MCTCCIVIYIDSPFTANVSFWWNVDTVKHVYYQFQFQSIFFIRFVSGRSVVLPLCPTLLAWIGARSRPPPIAVGDTFYKVSRRRGNPKKQNNNNRYISVFHRKTICCIGLYMEILQFSSHTSLSVLFWYSFTCT